MQDVLVVVDQTNNPAVGKITYHPFDYIEDAKALAGELAGSGLPVAIFTNTLIVAKAAIEFMEVEQKFNRPIIKPIIDEASVNLE